MRLLPLGLISLVVFPAFVNVAGAAARDDSPHESRRQLAQVSPTASNTGRQLQRSTSQNGSQSVGKSDSRGAATRGDQPLPLAPRSKRKRSESDSQRPRTSGQAIITVLGSLSVVLGLFFLVTWFARKALPKSSGQVPDEVIEVLGRAPLTGKQHMQMVRFGNKLLLLSVSATSSSTLAEISDVEEVDRLAGICRQNQPGSISSTFRQVLSQFSSEPEAESSPVAPAASTQVASQTAGIARRPSRSPVIAAAPDARPASR